MREGFLWQDARMLCLPTATPPALTPGGQDGRLLLTQANHLFFPPAPSWSRGRTVFFVPLCCLSVHLHKFSG